jgi:hypothetical protein
VGDAFIPISMFWCDEGGTKVPESSKPTLEIPVCVIVDCSIIGISKRVPDRGNVFSFSFFFATLIPDIATEIAFVNAFLTETEVVSEPCDIMVHMPKRSLIQQQFCYWGVQVNEMKLL